MQYLVTSTVPSVLFVVSILLFSKFPACLLRYQVMTGPGLAALTKQDTLTGWDLSEISSGSLSLARDVTAWRPGLTVRWGPVGMAGGGEGLI